MSSACPLSIGNFRTVRGHIGDQVYNWQIIDNITPHPLLNLSSSLFFSGEFEVHILIVMSSYLNHQLNNSLLLLTVNYPDVLNKGSSDRICFVSLLICDCGKCSSVSTVSGSKV